MALWYLSEKSFRKKMKTYTKQQLQTIKSSLRTQREEFSRWGKGSGWISEASRKWQNEITLKLEIVDEFLDEL